MTPAHLPESALDDLADLDLEHWTARYAESAAAARTALRPFVLVRVGGERFAVNLDDLDEVACVTTGIALPHVNPLILGLANIRGELLPPARHRGHPRRRRRLPPGHRQPDTGRARPAGPPGRSAGGWGGVGGGTGPGSLPDLDQRRIHGSGLAQRLGRTSRTRPRPARSYPFARGQLQPFLGDCPKILGRDPAKIAMALCPPGTLWHSKDSFTNGPVATPGAAARGGARPDPAHQ